MDRTRHDIFVIDCCRTPIGRHRGALSGVRPDDFAATVLAALLARNDNLDPAEISDVVWGAANQAGEDNRNVARMAVLLAGLPARRFPARRSTACAGRDSTPSTGQPPISPSGSATSPLPAASRR